MATAAIARRRLLCALTRLRAPSTVFHNARNPVPVPFSASMGSSPLRLWPRFEIRNMSCCAGLGTPPPREIIIEYCEDSNYTDYFIKLADMIEEAYPELIVLGNPDEMQSRKGSFEVKVGDTVLFSKLQSNRLPSAEEVLKGIDNLPSQCEIESSKSSALS